MSDETRPNVQMAPTDSELIARARSGEEEAFRMLVERHSRSVFRLAYRLTGNQHDAEEAVQETFLRVFKKLDGFEARSRFKTWLYRVGSNCAMDTLRSRKRHADRQQPLPDERMDTDPFLASGTGPDEHMRGTEVGDRIATAMEALTPGERAAFTLRHVQGMSIKEIGEVLGLRSNAVKNAVFRAVRKMREELAPIASELS